jgi:hypothetical protein
MSGHSLAIEVEEFLISSPTSRTRGRICNYLLLMRMRDRDDRRSLRAGKQAARRFPTINKTAARIMRIGTRRASALAAEDQRASLISIRDHRSLYVAQTEFRVAGKDLLLLSPGKDFGY